MFYLLFVVRRVKDGCKYTYTNYDNKLLWR
jgi:hypothetical protein